MKGLSTVFLLGEQGSPALVLRFALELSRLDLLREFDEEDLVSHLEPAVRERFEAALRRRLARRSPREMALHHRTVTVVGRRTRR